jgi:hypothetical protein
MTEKRWLTKDEKRLLKPHAEHYRAMGLHIRDAMIDDLEKLSNACRACTEVNCGWQEYAAAQYLVKEIDAEVGWRNRRDAAAAEDALPTAHILDRMADDGGRVHEPQ